jgi:hypothetical protein
VWDKGYDATSFYQLQLGLGITPITPLAQVAKTPQDSNGQLRDDDGTPLCPGGRRMRRHGYNKKTKKLVYCCPAKRPGRTEGKPCIKPDLAHCPRGHFCEPDSVMGPILNLAVDDDPRLNPPVARNSELFRDLYNKRGGVERFFSQIKEVGKLGKRPYRRQHLYWIVAYTQAIGMHARAWVPVVFGDQEGMPAERLSELLAARAEQVQVTAQAA